MNFETLNFLYDDELPYKQKLCRKEVSRVRAYKICEK